MVFCCISCRAISEKPAPHSDAGHALIGDFIKVAREEYGLILYGQGGGFIDKVNRFFFHFISFEEVDKDQARKILHYCNG